MSSQVLSGKVAIVTGGSKGIGLAISTALVKLGANVALNYGRDSAAANVVVKQLGGEANAQKTVDKFGKIDIEILNAGVLPMKTVSATSEEDFDKTFALNVKGPYFLVQKAIPYLSEGSTIIFISTTQNHASTVSAPYTLYCSTKGAIEQMTRTISKDLAGKEISVNCVAPGPTGTDLFFEGKSEQMLKTIAGLNPRNRIGKPEDVADTIVMLTTPAARWVTGQVIRANGGAA